MPTKEKLRSVSTNSFRSEESEPAATRLPQRVARSLHRRHLTALGAMAMLVVISFAVLHTVIVRHNAVNGHVMQLVGRQRMLSQRLCKAALVLVGPASLRATTTYKNEIKTALDDWQSSHAEILRNPLVSDLSQPALREELARLQPEYEAMTKAARHLLQFRQDAASEQMWPDVDQLLLHERPYLDTMEQITRLFVRESLIRDRQADWLSLGIGFALLITIVAEALLVFRPARRQLESAIRKTGLAWEAVSRRDRELATLLAALPDLIVHYRLDGTCIGTYAGHDADAEGLTQLVGGRPLLSLMPPGQAAECQNCVKSAVHDGGVQRLECIVQQGSEERHIEMRLFALHPDELVALMRDVTAQRQVERQVLNAVDQEQQRIGRDLHDSVCQTLSGLNLVLRSSLQKVRNGGTVSESEIAMYVRFAEQSVADIRQIARGLLPVDLDALGLKVGLGRMVETLGALHRVTCTCDVSIADYEPLPDVAVQIYRIAQEAVSNALRHARASRVTVALSVTQRIADGGRQRELTLEVTDDGTGIAVVQRTQGRLPPLGMGLRTMVYRAQCIGARFRIDSDPGGGTVVCCQFPLPDEVAYVEPAAAAADAPERPPSSLAASSRRRSVTTGKAGA